MIERKLPVRCSPAVYTIIQIHSVTQLLLCHTADNHNKPTEEKWNLSNRFT